MSVINTNVKSLVAQNALTINGRDMSKTMEQLSTGKRINSAADDAAGLAISNKMTSQVRGLNQAVRNANDAISMIQTAEGALGEVNNMLQRIRELAVQSANDTNSDADRGFLQKEVDDLLAEIDRVGANTQFNNMNILKKGVGVGEALEVAKFQVGANGTNTEISVTFNEVNAKDLTVEALKIDKQADAKAAIAKVDAAIKLVDTDRADYGAKINRLTYAADNMTNIATNTAASRSRILDTDYAQATTNLARTQIIQQAATAMLAQANQQPSSVLSLLQ
jgi:flagellin